MKKPKFLRLKPSGMSFLFLCGAVATSVLSAFPVSLLLMIVIKSETEMSRFEFYHMYVYVHVGLFACILSVIYFGVEVWQRLRTFRSVDVTIEASRYYVEDQATK